MAPEALDMWKFALALFIFAAAVPAFGETLPIVIRGGGSTVRLDIVAPQTQTATVCWTRINSIGNMPYRHCATIELSR